MSSKASKRRGRPIVVDGTTYYWKVRVEHGQAKVHVLLPTGRRICVPEYEFMPPRSLAITPRAVATLIQRVISSERSAPSIVPARDHVLSAADEA